MVRPETWTGPAWTVAFCSLLERLHSALQDKVSPVWWVEDLLGSGVHGEADS